MVRILAIQLICALSFFGSALAQGCSDAGFCTAGAMSSGGLNKDSVAGRFSTGLSYSLGLGENGTVIHNFQLEAGIQTSARSSIELKINYMAANGNLGDHQGIGDPIITYNRQWFAGPHKKMITTSLGTRIGVGNANAEYNGPALPMPYQSSLGTTDLIAGLSFQPGRSFSFSAGYQVPILNYNYNKYLPTGLYPASQNKYEYFASRNIVRKGDVLLRADYILSRNKIRVIAGPLIIYHLGNDEVTDAQGKRVQLSGSDGATLNLTGSVSYAFKASRAELGAGMPLVVRDQRPDGLTRALVVTLKYIRLK